MNQELKNKLQAELLEILGTMDIPRVRTTDWGWLSRNIHIKNGQHPKINAARQLITQLLRLDAQNGTERVAVCRGLGPDEQMERDMEFAVYGPSPINN